MISHSSADAAHQSLLKLLAKLAQIDAETAAAPLPDSDHAPIAALAAAGKLDQTTAMRAVAERLGIPCVEVDRNNVQQLVLLLEQDTIRKVSIHRWRTMLAMPVAADGNRVTVAFANPLAHEVKSALEFELGVLISPAIAAEEHILQVLAKQFTVADKSSFDDLLIPSEPDSLGALTNQSPTAESAVFGEDNVLQQAEQHGIATAQLRHPVGCDECGQSGYAGRTGVYSFLEITEPIREGIRAGKSEHEIEQLARGNGFKSLAEAGRDLIAAGTTTIDEVVRVLGPLDEINGAMAPAAIRNAVAQPASGFARRKILLVEDDENTRSILSMLFQNEFFDVVEAENGFDGLEKTFTAPPDIIVLDLMMPRMGGLEMLKKLRADARTRNLPVLMLTAAGTEENELKLISDGADDFVAKGADTRVLLARIERLLSRTA